MFPDMGGGATTPGALDSSVDLKADVFMARAGLSYKF